MISVEEANKIIVENSAPLQPVQLSLRQAVGKILADDVVAAADMPPFPQSSMDGYAFLFSEWESNKKLILEGEIPAGLNEKILLAPGKAVRIFTGAPVPPGADTVVMQEKAQIREGMLIIDEGAIQKGANVRPMGSEIKAHELALEKGRVLSAPAIGFLAGIGVAEVKVFPNPLISIIITGKELQQSGRPLDYGQVYESNSLALSAALQQGHFNEVKIYYADDDLEIVKNILQNALEQSDIVLLSGGISTGDYDFVLKAASDCGVTRLFHKIKQRPGKPLYFGKKGNKLVFGLPGNPSSVLTCFYEYVLPALEILTQRKLSLQKIHAPLAAPYYKTPLLTHFLKGFYNGTNVEVLDAQESYRLSSFAKANCLIKIKEKTVECKEGEMTEVHLLPG